MQFQADLLGIPVQRPQVLETTALGAAYLAGLAAGVWSNRDAIRAKQRLERRFEPRLAAQARADLLEGWRRAVERARGWGA
jgi:glycerol kinase